MNHGTPITKRWNWVPDHVTFPPKPGLQRMILENGNATPFVRDDRGIIERDGIECDMSGYPELQGDRLKYTLSQEGTPVSGLFSSSSNTKVEPPPLSAHDKKQIENIVAGKSGLPVSTDTEPESVRLIRVLVVAVWILGCLVAFNSILTWILLIR